MSEKHYPYYGGAFDRIVFDKDGSVWVPETKLRGVESENASLRGATQGLGRLCDRYKAENAKLRKFAKIDTEDIDTMSRLVDDLRAENDRLRDLCEDMYRECAKSMGYDHPLLKEFGIEVGA